MCTKLAEEIDESASVVVGDGMVSQMMSSRDKLRRATLSCLSLGQPAVKVGYMEKFDARDGAEGTEERDMECHDTMIRLVMECHEEAVTWQVDSTGDTLDSNTQDVENRCCRCGDALGRDRRVGVDVFVYGMVDGVFLRPAVESIALLSLSLCVPT